VPDSGGQFFEWQERDGKRQPFRVMLKSGEPFCFAVCGPVVKPPAAGKFDTDLNEARRARRLNRSPSSPGGERGHCASA